MEPIIDGLISYLAPVLNCSIWDGETPRTDATGQPIGPGSTQVPTAWPVVQLEIVEPGFKRTWTMADPYKDRGYVSIKLWSTTRAQTEAMMRTIVQQLASVTNWNSVVIPNEADPSNLNYAIQILLDTWWSGQEKGVRVLNITGPQNTGKSELLYRGDMLFDIMIHGAVSTS